MLFGLHACCICFVMFYGDMMDEVMMMMMMMMMLIEYVYILLYTYDVYIYLKLVPRMSSANTVMLK